MDNLSRGNKGEDLACQYLKKQGYQILERNFRIRGGEIDIIAQDGEYLVFVEVKTRYSHEYGLPVESMTPWKIKYVLRTAKYYLQQIDWGDGPFRLDFVGVDFLANPDEPKIELIQNITA
jgi:putative endonuclease